MASILALSLLPRLCFPQVDLGGNRIQEPRPDTLRSRNNASVILDKSLDTYHWTGSAVYQYLQGPWTVKLNEQFLSTLIETNPTVIRDEQSLDFLMKHLIGGPLQSAVQVTSYSLSDNQSVGIGNASSNGVYAGAEYSPSARLSLLPLIGYRFDNQLGLHDNGPSYRLGLMSDSLDWGGYRTGVNGQYEYDNLNPRAAETRVAAVTVDKNFFEDTRNMLRVQYNRNRRDFYDAADPVIQQEYDVSKNIESRTDDSYGVFDLLDYRANRDVLLSFQGDLYGRRVTRGLKYEDLTNPRRPTLGTYIDELNFDFGSAATLNTGGSVSGTARFDYQERDEQHGVQNEANELQFVTDSLTKVEERRNNHSRRAFLSLSLGIIPGSSDSIALAAGTSLLRYDTPVDLNDDERDELRYILSLTASHRFSRYLTARLLTEADLTHLVYLLSTRSADNTWNRIFRLSPRLEYNSGGGFTSVNSFEVLANYTVYDFEYLVSPIRSFVFRQFGYLDSTSLDLTRRLALEWFSQVRLYEQGELRWSEFSERPLNYFVDKTYIGTVDYRPEPELAFSVGIRYFSQSRYGYQGSDRQLQSFLHSLGPIAAVRWSVGARTRLSVKGWYENQSLTGQADRSFTNLTAVFTVLI